MPSHSLNRDTLIADLKRDEGLRLTVYDDSNGKRIVPGSTVIGHPTVGIGRALDVRGITEAEAEYLLGNDVDFFTSTLRENLPWFDTLDEVRQRVLVNMGFNLGITGLLKFHDTLRYCQEGRWELAAKAMEASLWFKQVGNRGKRLAALMRNGEAPIT